MPTRGRDRTRKWRQRQKEEALLSMSPQDDPQSMVPEVAKTGPRADMFPFRFGYRKGIPDPNLKAMTFEDLEKMRWDDTIFCCLILKELLTLSHLGKYEHEDTRITDFVLTAFEEMEGTIYQHVKEALHTALWSGYSATEMVWKVLDDGEFAGRWGISKLKVLPPQSLQPDGFEIDEYGRVTEIVQYRGQMDKERRLPVHKIARWCYREMCGNPYGDKVLRAAYMPWVSKTFGVQTWDGWIDRVGIPPFVMYLPQVYADDPERKLPGPDGTLLPGFEAMEAWGAEIRRLSTIVTVRDPLFPSQRPVEPLYTDISGDNGMKEHVTYHDGSMARVMLVPLLTTTETQYGSKAQSETHQDVATLDPEATVKDITAALIVEQELKPLIIANFGRQKHYGQFRTVPFSEKDWQKISQAIATMTQSGWISPKREEAQKWVATQLDMPESVVEPEPPDPDLVAKGYQTKIGNYIPNAGAEGGGQAANGGNIKDREPTKPGAKVADKGGAK